MKVKYPIEEGWITAKLELAEPGTILDRDLVLNSLMDGHPENYELAQYRNMKTLVKVIYRKKDIKCSLCGSTDFEGLIKLDGEEEYNCYPDCK